jgi:acetyl esterase/lipase
MSSAWTRSGSRSAARALGAACPPASPCWRDRVGPRLCFQFLGIPELDDRLDTASIRGLVGTPITTIPNGEISWDSYLGTGVRGTDGVSPYAAPARATDLTGLPPALVTAYEFDGLRDEGIDYARRLMSAGVPTDLRVYSGAFHSCTWLSEAAICQRILGDVVGAMRRRLHARVPEAV